MLINSLLLGKLRARERKSNFVVSQSLSCLVSLLLLLLVNFI